MIWHLRVNLSLRTTWIYTTLKLSLRGEFGNSGLRTTWIYTTLKLRIWKHGFFALFKNYLNLHYSQTIPLAWPSRWGLRTTWIYTTLKLDRGFDEYLLGLRTTWIYTTLKLWHHQPTWEALFKNYLNLHYSQTKSRQRRREGRFKNYLNLHYSQTSNPFCKGSEVFFARVYCATTMRRAIHQST